MNHLVNFLISKTGQIMRRTRCQSRYEKNKKKQRLQAAAESQKGALDKFIVKESPINPGNQTLDADVDHGHSDNVV
jgi:hypothetical protein